MEVPGFNLLLQDFCGHCPDFEPDIEKIDCSSISEPFRNATNIRCRNRKKCARIAENIRKRGG